MKKLLSLLSVLTISGTAVPTTIAASPYQKEETIKNSDINYQQTNNLESLDRNKRDFFIDPAHYAKDHYKLSKDISNRNLGIIKNNNNDTLIKKIKEINGLNSSFINKDTISIADKNNTSAKIVPVNSYVNSNYRFNYPVSINYLIENDLNNTTSLLSEWNKNFSKWQNEVNYQIKNNLPKYGNDDRGKSLKRTWKDDKNFQLRSQVHSLNQNINIIMNNFYIKELKNRVQNLENDLSNLKYKVENLSSRNLLNECSDLSGFLGAVTSIVPVVGSISSAILGIISFACTIANS